MVTSTVGERWGAGNLPRSPHHGLDHPCTGSKRGRAGPGATVCILPALPFPVFPGDASVLFAPAGTFANCSEGRGMPRHFLAAGKLRAPSGFPERRQDEVPTRNSGVPEENSGTYGDVLTSASGT